MKHKERIHICPICGRGFLPKSGVQKYCQDPVRNCAYKAWYARRVKYKLPGREFFCEICGRKIKRRYATRFCSDHCAYVGKRRKDIGYAIANGYLSPKRQVDIFKKMAGCPPPEEKKIGRKYAKETFPSGIHYTDAREEQVLRQTEAKLRKARRYYK